MVVSCADPGIFARRGGPKNPLITFLGISFLQFYRGVLMVYFKENGSRGGPTFYRGGGPNFSRGGGGTC